MLTSIVFRTAIYLFPIIAIVCNSAPHHNKTNNRKEDRALDYTSSVNPFFKLLEENTLVLNEKDDKNETDFYSLTPQQIEAFENVKEEKPIVIKEKPPSKGRKPRSQSAHLIFSGALLPEDDLFASWKKDELKLDTQEKDEDLFKPPIWGSGRKSEAALDDIRYRKELIPSPKPALEAYDMSAKVSKSDESVQQVKLPPSLDKIQKGHQKLLDSKLENEQNANTNSRNSEYSLMNKGLNTKLSENKREKLKKTAVNKIQPHLYFSTVNSFSTQRRIPMTTAIVSSTMLPNAAVTFSTSGTIKISSSQPIKTSNPEYLIKTSSNVRAKQFNFTEPANEPAKTKAIASSSKSSLNAILKKPVGVKSNLSESSLNSILKEQVGAQSNLSILMKMAPPTKVSMASSPPEPKYMSTYNNLVTGEEEIKYVPLPVGAPLRVNLSYSELEEDDNRIEDPRVIQEDMAMNAEKIVDFWHPVSHSTSTVDEKDIFQAIPETDTASPPAPTQNSENYKIASENFKQRHKDGRVISANSNSKEDGQIKIKPVDALETKEMRTHNLKPDVVQSHIHNLQGELGETNNESQPPSNLVGTESEIRSGNHIESNGSSNDIINDANNTDPMVVKDKSDDSLLSENNHVDSTSTVLNAESNTSSDLQAAIPVNLSTSVQVETPVTTEEITSVEFSSSSSTPSPIVLTVTKFSTIVEESNTAVSTEILTKVITISVEPPKNDCSSTTTTTTTEESLTTIAIETYESTSSIISTDCSTTETTENPCTSSANENTLSTTTDCSSTTTTDCSSTTTTDCSSTTTTDCSSTTTDEDTSVTTTDETSVTTTYDSSLTITTTSDDYSSTDTISTTEFSSMNTSPSVLTTSSTIIDLSSTVTIATTTTSCSPTSENLENEKLISMTDIPEDYSSTAILITVTTDEISQITDMLTVETSPINPCSSITETSNNSKLQENTTESDDGSETSIPADITSESPYNDSYMLSVVNEMYGKLQRSSVVSGETGYSTLSQNVEATASFFGLPDKTNLLKNGANSMSSQNTLCLPI